MSEEKKRATGRPSRGKLVTLYARIPEPIMDKLRETAERKRWSKTVTVEELIDRFADQL